MIAFSYVTPQGEPIANPAMELLQVVILEQGANYWGQGSCLEEGAGDAYLGWVKYLAQGYTDVNDRPRLIFCCNALYGFHFMYDAPQQPRLVTYDGSGTQPQVKHYMGGEPMSLPRACFVTRAVAWQVTQDFCQTYQPSPAAAWIKASLLGL